MARSARQALLLAVSCLGVATNFAQSSSSTAGPGTSTGNSQAETKFAQLDPGTITGTTYTNRALGFSTPFPADWNIMPAAEQGKAIEANHAASYGDSEGAEREHEMVWRCTHILLWATKNPSTEVEVVTVVDSGCFPGVVFPASSEDRKGMQRFIENLRRPPLGQGKHVLGPDEKITTFVLQGHLMVDISNAETADEAPVYTSYVITPVKNYWLVWLLAAPSQTAMQEFKKSILSSLQFDVP